MGKFAIKFRHELSYEGERISLIELFEPYEIDVLLPMLDDNKELQFELEKAKSQQFSFDNFVSMLSEERKYEEYIEKKRESTFWIDDSTEIESESLWDYLADFQTVIEEYKSIQEELYSERLGMHAELTLLSRIHLQMAKLDLSLLIYSTWESDDIELEKQIILFYEWTMEIAENVQFAKLQYDSGEVENIIRAFKNSMSDNRIIFTVINICDWIKTIFESDNLSNHQLRKILKMIKEDFWKILSELGVMYEAKSKFIKRLNSVHGLKQTKHAIFKMVVSEEEFRNRKIDIFCKIIHNTIENNCKIPKISDVEFKVKFNQLRKFFWDNECLQGRSTIGKRVLNNYKQRDGCFAIMVEEGGKKYFSFSNVNEYEKYSSKDQYEDLACILMEKVFDPTIKVSVGDVRKHVYAFNWAYVSDMTLRYLPLGEKNADKAEYLVMPIALKYDPDIHNIEDDKSKIGTSYGCCERKMLAFSNNALNLTFFTRWAPCERCRPAMMSGLNTVKIYALAEKFDTSNEIEKMTELNEYHIVKKYDSKKVIV